MLWTNNQKIIRDFESSKNLERVSKKSYSENESSNNYRKYSKSPNCTKYAKRPHTQV